MSFGGTPPATPARWNQAEAERLAQYARPQVCGWGSPVAQAQPDLTPHEKSLIFVSLCARVDELNREPLPYSGIRTTHRVDELVELSKKLQAMGIIALNLEGYAR